jgi:hypothetical protein
MPVSPDTRPETGITTVLLCLVPTQSVQYFIDNQTRPAAPRARQSALNLPQV